VRTAAVAVALLAALSLPVAAQSRHDQALSDLRRADDAQARRAAVRALADTGVMADLPAMAQALRDSDPQVRALTESAMWEVWSRTGEAEIDGLFARGVDQLQMRQLDEAVQTFTRIIARRPDFAEAWNKRATAYFVLGEYEKSLADCDQVMTRNPTVLQPSEPIKHALHFMATNDFMYLPLVDEAGRPVDMLSFRRVARLIEQME